MSIFLYPISKELWHSKVLHCKRHDCIYKKGDDLNGSKEWRVGSSGECRRPITHGLQIAGMVMVMVMMVIITGIMVIMMLVIVGTVMMVLTMMSTSRIFQLLSVTTDAT